MRGDGVDDPAAEARDVAAELDRQQIGPRIEPDDELAALALDLGREAVAEGEGRDGHARAHGDPENDRGRLSPPSWTIVVRSSVSS